MVQSNYNFILLCVIACVHSWLHGRAAVPHVMWLHVPWPCPTLSCVEINSYTAIRVVVAACPTQLNVEGIQ